MLSNKIIHEMTEGDFLTLIDEIKLISKVFGI